MNTFDMASGWMFAAIAALFALGLAAPFSHRFYVGSPSFPRRLAAPVIFAALAAASFAGVALQALSLVTIFGMALIAVSRRNGRKPPPLT